MTNGEKIKKLFPNLTYKEGGNSITLNFDNYIGTVISHNFWYAEYQEPTTKNNLAVDCINRAELLKTMNTWDKFGYTETGCFVREPKGDYVPYVHYDDMVNCVKGMPSVTPQIRKGHWTDDGYCSCCNKQTLPLDISGYASGYDSFCPNCGADMREVEE